MKLNGRLKKERKKGNVWGVVFTNVLSFLLRILRCCFGSTLGTEQCLSEINTTQGEEEEKEG